MKARLTKILQITVVASSIQFIPSISWAEACVPKPVNCRLTSSFGPRMHPVHKVPKMHKGNDFGCPAGTPVLSPANGSTSFSGNIRGGGNTVGIRAGGYEMKFMHNYRNLVQIGDKVVTGQEIAKVGNTGWSTGPHLHFEIHVAGQPKDPQLMLCGGTPAPANPPSNPGGGSQDGGGNQGGGNGSGGSMEIPEREGLDGSFWDVLSGAVGSRALNPAYPYQLSTLDEPRLFEELNYLEGIQLLVSLEKNQAIKRMLTTRSILQATRLQEQKRAALDRARAQAISSAGK